MLSFSLIAFIFSRPEDCSNDSDRFFIILGFIIDEFNQRWQLSKQLFALGILGEYLARMFQRLMDRPAFAVVERTGTGAAAAATSQG